VFLPTDTQGSFLHNFVTTAAKGHSLSYKLGFMEIIHVLLMFIALFYIRICYTVLAHVYRNTKKKSSFIQYIAAAVDNVIKLWQMICICLAEPEGQKEIQTEAHAKYIYFCLNTSLPSSSCFKMAEIVFKIIEARL
jgi:hypothetical protein